MAPVLIPRGDKKLFKESMVKRGEKEGANKRSTRRSYMYPDIFAPRVKEDSSRVTTTRRMKPRALTLVPWSR